MNDLRRWMMLCETQGEHDGDAYFDLSKENFNDRSRETLVYMSPQDFLAMAKTGYDGEKAARVASVLRRDVKFESLPLLKFEHDGKGMARVVGHDGRHRSRALQRLGVQQMPVVLLSLASMKGRGIRWGRQGDTNDFDYVPVMPTRMRGEDGYPVIPMPKSVIFP